MSLGLTLRLALLSLSLLSLSPGHLNLQVVLLLVAADRFLVLPLMLTLELSLRQALESHIPDAVRCVFLDDCPDAVPGADPS
uniref:Secreted protein n=1 Tax=Anopheles arabiensis TaxID=7173 RepID=A0A182IH12_ANOAR